MKCTICNLLHGEGWTDGVGCFDALMEEVEDLRKKRDELASITDGHSPATWCSQCIKLVDRYREAIEKHRCCHADTCTNRWGELDCGGEDDLKEALKED